MGEKFETTEEWLAYIRAINEAEAKRVAEVEERSTREAQRLLDHQPVEGDGETLTEEEVT